MPLKTMLSLSFLITLLLTATSYAEPTVVSKASELTEVLKAIPQGQSKVVVLEGELRPYSGKFPKGMGINEIAVGDQTLLIRSIAKKPADMKKHLNKTVRARVKISHLPLADSMPESQQQGHWITEITEIKSIN